MTKKQEVMNNDPKLFKGFHDAVKRGEHLRMPVFLCDDTIELYVFEGKKRGEQPISGGPVISNIVRYPSYSQEDLNGLNAMLDARADALREKWLPEYRKLNESAAGGFCIDLSIKDYAELSIYANGMTTRVYELDWCYEGLLAAAKYLSRSLNPVIKD